MYHQFIIFLLFFSILMCSVQGVRIVNEAIRYLTNIVNLVICDVNHLSLFVW